MPDQIFELIQCNLLRISYECHLVDILSLQIFLKYESFHLLDFLALSIGNLGLFHLSDLLLLDRVVNSGQKLDNRYSDLIRDLLVGAPGQLSIEFCDLNQIDLGFRNFICKGNIFPPRMEIISFDLLDENWSLEFLQLILLILSVRVMECNHLAELSWFM